MNEYLFLYKKRFIAFILLLGYAYMHVKLTGMYSDNPFDKMTDFTVRLPFGQRLFVPLLVNFLKHFLPLDLPELYFLMEWLFIALFYFALLQLMQEEFNKQQAQVLSWLFLLLLPLVTVINYRFTTHGEATFFYSYDTPTLFFMTLGFLFCLRSQWFYFIPLVFIATVNRESSLLLVLMIPALHSGECRLIYKQILLSAVVYLLARWLVLHFLQGVPGELMEWCYFKYTHFNINLYWLFNMQHIVLFAFCFAGLPLFWFTFYDYIPLKYRPLRYVALFYFLSLLLVGNFLEVRIFSEILILLYLPVCVGLSQWLYKPGSFITNTKSGVSYYVDRYAVLFILIMVAVFHQLINESVVWFYPCDSIHCQQALVKR